MIHTQHLLALRGPNIHLPQAGVLLRAACDRDRSRRVRAALKDAAQFIGLVVAHLAVEAHEGPGGWLLTARFATAQPAIGAAMAAYVVEGVRAEVAGDEDWDRDGPLLELRDRCRAAAPPLEAVQLAAEARSRGLPAAWLPDGRLLIGQGERGWVYGPGAGPAPPWGRLGPVPIVAVTGAPARRAAALALAAEELAAAGRRPAVSDGAGFDGALALLADPATPAAAIGLSSADLLSEGLPFEGCAAAILAGGEAARPPAALDDEEWARAQGLPMLVAAGPARADLADPLLQRVLGYAPAGVIALGPTPGAP